MNMHYVDDMLYIAQMEEGEGKLRKLVSDNPNAEYLLWNGNRVQIKRTRFEKFIDTLSAI